MGNCSKKNGAAIRGGRATSSLDEFTLTTLPDHELELTIIDYVDSRLARCADGQDEAGILASLPAGMRALYLTWTVESEVIDGGFARYFWNWAGQFAAQAAEAFEYFLAHDHARLMREANRVYAEECGTTYVSDGRELIDAYQSWRLQLLEDHFYQLDEGLSPLRIARIRSQPRLFCDK